MAGNQFYDSLKARFSQAEIALAAAIGSDIQLSLRDKIGRLFTQLDDPLLSAKDVQLLLQVTASEGEISATLGECCAEGALEKTTGTQRALDKEGETLFRNSSQNLRRMKIFGTANKLTDGTERLTFTLDGRLIRAFAAVDRLDAIAGTGQQRDEIIKHVKEISEGIKDGIQVPNSILLTFNSDVFVWDEDISDPPPASWVICRKLGDWSVITLPDSGGRVIQEVAPIELDIPYRNAAFDEEKCALLVDGQQRTAALALVDIDAVPSFQLSVNATITSPEVARQTFRVANNTVKISTDFSRALLGLLDEVPGYVRQERRIAQAVKILALDDAQSPFFKLVKHPGMEGRGFPIAYNTLFSVVSSFENSGLEFGEDPHVLAETVSNAFCIVREVWTNAWGKSPKDSRLMHGAGLRAVGSVLVDLIKVQVAINNHDINSPAIWPEIRKSLARLESKVLWTADEALKGSATQKNNFLREIENRQNTNQDIQGLTNFLIKEANTLDKKAKEKNA